MKKVTIVFILIVMAAALQAQDNIDYRKAYEHKVKTYKGMRTAGILLTMAGGCTTLAGVVLVAQDDWVMARGTGTQEPELTGGSYALIAGIGMLVPGIIFTAMGSHKLKDYNERLKNLDVGVIYLPNQKGFKLSYRF